MKKGKTIYINESFLKNPIMEASIGRRLPSGYQLLAERGKFPFSENQAFPDIYDVPFCYKSLEREYAKAKENILKLGSIDFINEDSTIENAITQILTAIHKKESVAKNQLEKLCNNYVIDLFQIPEDTIVFNIKSVDKVNYHTSTLQLDPEDSELEYKDVREAENFKMETRKRLIINMLVTGAALYYSNDLSVFAKDLYNIDSDLASLYKKFDILNRYSLLSNPEIHMTENNKMMSGVVSVDLGNDENKTVITSEGESFPILLYETIKGVFDLIATHGLPKDISIANAIIKKCDFVKAEPWNMKIGPDLWEKFMDACGNIETKQIPYIFMEICSLSTFKFNKLMKEIFAGTAKGKRMVSQISENIEYQFFLDKMSAANTDKNIIEDEYISEEEL